MGTDRDDEEQPAPPPRPYTPTYQDRPFRESEKRFEPEFDDESGESSAEPERRGDDERR